METVTAYINAGGQGSRLQSIFKAEAGCGLAKALLEVGQPSIALIDHHISKLSAAGIEKIVVGTGHQSRVADYVDSRYVSDGRICSASTDRQLGTAGELQSAIDQKPSLFGKHTYVCNVDTILDILEPEFYAYHSQHPDAVSIALTRNRGVPNEGAYYLDSERSVVYSQEIAQNPITLEEAVLLAADRASSTGAVMIDTDYIASYDLPESNGAEISLYRHFMGAAILDRQVRGYDNGYKFFTDIGTVGSWSDAKRSATVQSYLQYPANYNDVNEELYNERRHIIA